MEDTIRLTNSSTNRNQQGSDSVDDEYSTDSGCSSGSSSGSSSGGSSSSAEHLPRCRKSDHESSSSSHRRINCHLHHADSHHHHHEIIMTRSQERLSRSKHIGQRGRVNKTLRSCSLSEPGCHSKMSPSHSSSPSDAHSTDSELSKKSSKPEILRRALQCLKLGKNEDNGCKEKKLTKKSPRRILREPVLYTYVRGLSGLPTQRVPRSNVRAFETSCSCQDNINLYWNDPDRR